MLSISPLATQSNNTLVLLRTVRLLADGDIVNDNGVAAVTKTSQTTYHITCNHVSLQYNTLSLQGFGLVQSNWTAITGPQSCITSETTSMTLWRMVDETTCLASPVEAYHLS